MSNAFYTVWRNGEQINAGYGVEAVCEEPGCDEGIDRGLAFLCGVTPGGDEYGCGGYFCGKHLNIPLADDVPGNFCLRCIDR
ncbi:hypothetical protein [Streptomyces sp. NPDC020917]|uniref:hypothetical protein n=1 Tax=Streptomyces sp. NPDC020917 TaxID=3365102 RepID=UPI0037898BEE